MEREQFFCVDLDFSHLHSPNFCPCIIKKRHVIGFFWSFGKYLGLLDVWVLWKFLHLDEPDQEGGAAEWTNNFKI